MAWWACCWPRWSVDPAWCAPRVSAERVRRLGRGISANLVFGSADDSSVGFGRRGSVSTAPAAPSLPLHSLVFCGAVSDHRAGTRSRDRGPRHRSLRNDRSFASDGQQPVATRAAQGRVCRFACRGADPNPWRQRRQAAGRRNWRDCRQGPRRDGGLWRRVSQPAASAFVDGWFRTGDLGRIDSDGYVFIAGRLKEVVNRGGEKVSPREVDDALLEHPLVSQAAAFGVPHPTLGEDLVAAVVAKPNSGLVESTLRHFLICTDGAAQGAVAALVRRRTAKGQHGQGATTQAARTARCSASDNGSLKRPEISNDQCRRFSVRSCSSMPLECMTISLRWAGTRSRGCARCRRSTKSTVSNLAATALFHHPTVAELAVVIDQAAAAMRTQEAELMRDIESMTDEEVEQALAAEEAALRERSEPDGQ